MIETIISGIVLAAISGLTFIAYKHPKGYFRIHIPLTTIIGSTMMCILFWNFGVMTAHSKLIKFLVTDTRAEQDAIIDSITVNVWWVVGINFVIMMYLTFLLFMRNIIPDESISKPKDESLESKP